MKAGFKITICPKNKNEEEADINYPQMKFADCKFVWKYTNLKDSSCSLGIEITSDLLTDKFVVLVHFCFLGTKYISWGDPVYKTSYIPTLLFLQVSPEIWYLCFSMFNVQCFDFKANPSKTFDKLIKSWILKVFYSQSVY